MPFKQILHTTRYSEDMGDGKIIGGNCEAGAKLMSPNEYTDYKYETTKRYANINPGALYQSKKQNTDTSGGSIFKVALGLLLIIIAILGFTYPLKRLLLTEKLNMRPGLPPYDWWSDPPETMKMRSYIFNVTNHERFLAGLDAKINVEEIGPIVYFESLKYSNIKFTENDTLTYNSDRHQRLSVDETKVHLNATLIVPNFALLGIASMLQSTNMYYYRMGFNLLLKMYPNKLFIETTVYNFLWNFRNNIVVASRRLVPGMVPSENMGMLARTYELLKSEVSVKIGQKWGEREFFHIYDYKDLPQFTGQDHNMCLNKIENVTEGILFPQNLKKDDVLLFLSKPLCNLIPLLFEEELNTWGLTYYRYNFSKTAFDHKPDMPNCRNNHHLLPSGIKDSSMCFYDFPMVLSLPHFTGVDIPKDHYVTGLKPDPDKYRLGYYDIEPQSGIPISLNLKVQCSLWIRNITGLYPKQYDILSNLVIPLLTLEYDQESLPPYLMNTVYFTFVILPVLSTFILCCILLLGIVTILKQNDSKKLKTIFNRFSLASVSRFSTRANGNK